VQGNSPAGYFTPHDYGDLLLAQYNATMPLIERGVKPDVLVWPEGATDVDPITDSRAATYFDYLSSALDAPIVSGDITTDGDITHNSSIVWEAGQGAVGQYDKRHPVPFGEYVPLRSLLEPLAPSLIGLIGREYTPGTNSPVLDVKGIAVGVNICFDIVDDALLTQTVDAGARIIFAQSNNADFGTSDESVQQLAIARIRAMELGRSVVVISTVGQSEIIAPDGSQIDTLTPYTAGAMVDDVPLSSARTPASSASVPLPWSFGLMALAMLVVAGFLGHTKRRPRSEDRERRQGGGV
jgi:apolipoprotein N-acyltransferase